MTKSLFLIIIGTCAAIGCRSVHSSLKSEESEEEGSKPGIGAEAGSDASYRRDMLTEFLQEVVGDDLDGVTKPAEARCSQNCHNHQNLDANKLEVWIKQMVKVQSDCKVLESHQSRRSNKKIATCILAKATQSGFLRASFRTSAIEEIFTKARMESEYATLLSQAMPPAGAAIGPLSEEVWDSFGRTAFMFYKASQEPIGNDLRAVLVNEGGTGLLGPSLPTCKDETAPALTEHIKEMDRSGWGARNLNDLNVRMFACQYDDHGQTNALACFNDATYKHSDGSAIFPLQPNLLAPDVKQGAGAGTVVRQLKNIGTESTSYWMRTSADGRFILVGNRGVERLDAQISGGTESIKMDGLDPGFFPNNQGFVMQAGGLMMCKQKLFDDPAVLADKKILFAEYDGSEEGEIAPGQQNVQVDGRQMASPAIVGRLCSTTGSVSMYQSVAQGLSGGDYFYLSSGTWEGDPGSIYRDIPVAAFASDNATVSLLLSQSRGEDAGYTIDSEFEMSTPGQGDWFLVPSSRMMVGRQASKEARPRHDGYVIRQLQTIVKDSSEGRRIQSIENPVVGRVCMNGRKATLSYDERFIATHAYVNRFDYGNYQFQSSGDPDFIKLKNNSADIWLADALTGKKYRVTNVGPDRIALYPHFRSDGWLYFMIKDIKADTTQYMATDVAVRIKSADGAPDLVPPSRR
jgi:hypothetical protein